jgi:DNA adenine methylase
LAELPQYLDRLAPVHISNTDELKCIEQWDSPQTFFYCDPPYPGSNQGHYSGYSVSDFERLIDTLNQCQGSFMLSCYEVPGVTIPDDWEKFEFTAMCSASGAGKVGADRSRKATSAELGNRVRTEVVYRRFNRVPVREEIQKLYDSGAYNCFAFPTGDPAPVKEAPSPTTTAPALAHQQLALF